MAEGPLECQTELCFIEICVQNIKCLKHYTVILLLSTNRDYLNIYHRHDKLDETNIKLNAFHKTQSNLHSFRIERMIIRLLTLTITHKTMHYNRQILGRVALTLELFTTERDGKGSSDDRFRIRFLEDRIRIPKYKA